MDKEIKEEFENLASMIKIGFDGVDKQFRKVNERLELLEDGQENIILRLDEKAHRFEVKDLERRVDRVELKLASVPI